MVQEDGESSLSSVIATLSDATISFFLSVVYYYRFLNTVTLLAAVCLNVCFVRGTQLIFKTLEI